MLSDATKAPSLTGDEGSDSALHKQRAELMAPEASLDELQAEHEFACESVRCDIDVTTPMAPRHRRRSPFSSQESVT